MTAIALALGFGVGVPLVWAAIIIGRRAQLVDRPGTIKIHASPVPHTGGVALLATLCLAAIVVPMPLAFVVAAVLTWAVGFVDDVRGLSAFQKLAGLVVPLAIAALGVGLALPAAVVAVVIGLVLVNAFNVTDGLDGLAAGTSLPPLLALSPETPVAAVAAGAVLAFLLFNLPPARIFLGDEGSLLIGMLLWSLPLELATQRFSLEIALFALLLWTFPLANLAFVVTMRKRSGRSILAGDRSHLYDVLHRRLGLRRALAVCWSIAGFAAVVAVTLGP